MGDSGTRCWTTISQYTGFFSIVVIETLIIVPCMVFTFINFIVFDDNSYTDYHRDFSNVVAYSSLLPLMITQAIWLVTNIIAILAICLIAPYLSLPNMIVSFLGVMICIWMFVPSVDHLLRSTSSVSWEYIGFVIGLAIFITALLVFLYVRYSTYRKLTKKKKTVRGTAEKTVPIKVDVTLPSTAVVLDAEEFVTSFSRRSTMSIHEDRSEMPPRM